MPSFLTEVTQLVLNGIMAGTILAVPAIGLTAIYAVLQFPNFALASHATVGAFAGYIANVQVGLPIVPSVMCAFLAAGLVGVVSDEYVLKPFRAAGFITTAIASIALTIGIENLIRFGFGNELRGYDLPLMRDWRFWGMRVGPQQVQNLGIAVVAMALLFAFLAFTRTGKAMRAVADNPMLAAIKGINADVVARLVSFVGMGLAGLGGMLIGLDTTIDPLTGFRHPERLRRCRGGRPGQHSRRGDRRLDRRHRRGAVPALSVAGLSQRRGLHRDPPGADLASPRHPRRAGILGHGKLPHRHGRVGLHLCADGAGPQRDLGLRRHGQFGPDRLLRRRCLRHRADHA